MCMYTAYTDEEIEQIKRETLSERQLKKRKEQIALKCIKEVDRLPNDFETFVSRLFEKVMFYKKVDFAELGYSTKGYFVKCECGCETILNRVRGKIKCPECGATVRMRNNYYGDLSHDPQAVALVEKATRGWVQRLFIVRKTSKENGIPVYDYVEEERDFLFPDGDIHMRHPTNSGWRFGPGQYHGSYYHGYRVGDMKINTYLCNLKSIYENSEYKYFPFEKAMKSHMQPLELMRNYSRHPRQIEMLYKFGLTVLAEELIGVRYCSRSIVEKLGNSKPRDLGIESKADIEYIKSKGFTSEQCFAWKEVKHWKINEADLMKAIDFVNDFYSDYLCSTDDYDFISKERLFNYCVKQKELNKETYRSVDNVLRDYRNYIDYARKLGWDLNDTMYQTPHNLKHMHDRALSLVEIERNKNFDNGIRKVYETLHKTLEVEKNGLCVLMPKSSKALISEGNAQKHCVGGYCEKVASGRCIILFLRRASAKKKAFFTIELKPNFDLVQCRGQGNYDYRNDKEVVDFIEKYLKKIKEKMKNEEKYSNVV